MYAALNLLIKYKFPPRIRQVYIALGPTLIVTNLGIAEGYSAILMSQLCEQNELSFYIPMDSWIASMAALPLPTACIFGGISMEVIGRKTVQMIGCVLCLSGGLALSASRNYYSILFGRSITGLCMGLLGPSTGVYLAETSEPKFRGFILALLPCAIAFGQLFCHLLGRFLSWQMVASTCCIFPIASFLIMLVAPESPTYLTKKGKVSLAKEAFYWCRGQNMEAEDELAILLHRQNVPMEQKTIYFYDYTKPEFFKPLLVTLALFFTAHCSGITSISFYNSSILRLALRGRTDKYFSLIVTDAIRLTYSMLACFLHGVVGRRPLVMISCIGTVISLLVLSCSMYLIKYCSDVVPFNHPVILMAFISYIGFLTIGLIPLPGAIMGEIFPLASRGVGSGISSLINYAFMFAVIKTTPRTFSSLKPEGTFLLYASLTLTGLIILSIVLPETKNKPLHVIEDGFKNVKN